MAVHPVLRMGDPRLARPADPVTGFPARELDALVADMWETMEAEGGIGLAAIQIGVPFRVVVFGLAEAEDCEELAIPRTVLVNPRIELLPDGLEDGWEGCLSVPGMRGLVPRHRRIVYRGHDAAGAPIEREAEGMHARVVQHECDHLDGILYPMRIRTLADFGFEAELARAGRLTGADSCTQA